MVLAEPGDVCAFVHPTTTSNDDEEAISQRGELICIYLCRFRQGYEGTEKERLVWLSSCSRQITMEDGVQRTVSLEVRSSCVVLNTPKLLSYSEKHMEKLRLLNPVSRTGFLDDGTPYVLYPIMMYHDDFHTSSLLFGHSSVGGCYILPIGFSNEMRHSSSSARPLSLAPSDMKSNEVLKYVMDDVAMGTVEGVMGTDPYGNSVRIFIDPIGFMADYPAVSSVLDVKSHTADAPCPLCSFTRRKNITGADYGYTVDIHSSRMSNVRFADRTYALREMGVDESSGKNMGMNEGGIEILESSPLYSLHKKFKYQRHKAALTADGSHVVSPCFDPYLNTAVAPDHALMGLSKNILQLFFNVLRDDRMRSDVEVQICTYLVSNGLPSHTSVYNKNTGGVHSMSMTSVFLFF